LPVHEADPFAVNGDVIGCNAGAVTRGNPANLRRIKAKTFNHR
jgi:hypothetical protein